MYEYYLHFETFYKFIAPDSIASGKGALIAFLAVAQVLLTLSLKLAHHFIGRETALIKKIKYLCWLLISLVMGLMTLLDKSKISDLKKMSLYVVVIYFLYIIQVLTITLAKKIKKTERH